MRQHESTFAAEHLKMMANRNLSIENKVTTVTRKTLLPQKVRRELT